MNRQKTDKEISESAPARDDDAYWLEQGKKLKKRKQPDLISRVDLGSLKLGCYSLICFGLFLIVGVFKEIQVTVPLLLHPLNFFGVGVLAALAALAPRYYEVIIDSPDDIKKTIRLIKEKKVFWAFFSLVGFLLGVAFSSYIFIENIIK